MASGLESTICCIICCIIGLSKMAIIWSGSMLAGIPMLGIPMPGIPPAPGMAPHGLAAAFGVALGVELDGEAVVLEGVVADGDPHGLGMAAPVDPSRVLLGLFVEDVVVLGLPICASMSGSWISRYILDNALKPPGMFCNCAMANS